MVKRLKKQGFLITIVATLSGLVLSGFLLYSSAAEHIGLVQNTALNDAKTHFKTVVIMRRWNAQHGGIYVKPDQNLKPNPFLKDPTIETKSGETLIKINPAWMTRQISELMHTEEDHTYRITRLNPINPKNEPDQFEREGLEFFQKNPDQDYYSKFAREADGNDHFHLIGKLRTEKSCLKCHADGGYKEGDVSGGIHVSLPAHAYQQHIDEIKEEAWILFALFSVFSGVFLLLSIRHHDETEERQKEIENLNNTLEQKVQERSQEVQRLYEEEKYLRSIMKTVGDVNKLLIQCHSQDELFEMTCNCLAQHRDYRLAWIGLLEGKNIRVAAKSKDPTNYITNTFFTCADPESPFSRGPTGQAILQKKTVLINDTQTDPRFEPWRERAKKSNLLASIGIPLFSRKEEAPIGTLCVYSSHKGGFESKEVAMLEELAGDISFAIQSFQQEETVKKLEQSIINNYEDTIISFVNMIEQRDSYTAGHTGRVAHYCKLIASEMGLPNEEVRKLEKAAILHDIGKIVTPDSILLHPGNLTDLEHDLIKQHVNSGYEMLSKIEMYQELADIIRYHHERYDGLGYPVGLRGEDIPLPSAIMAIADAYDAMTTNRIYKKEKSKETALLELENLRGKQFHPRILDYALKVFKENDISENTEQLPKTELEIKRFSYFFNDKLTGLYNEDYLKIILGSHHGNGTRSYLHTIYLRGFTGYNARCGWKEGNHFLQNMADFLEKSAPDSMIFRIMGDVFVILSSDESSVTKLETIQSAPFVKGSGLNLEIVHTDMAKSASIPWLESMYK